GQRDHQKSLALQHLKECHGLQCDIRFTPGFYSDPGLKRIHRFGFSLFETAKRSEINPQSFVLEAATRAIPVQIPAKPTVRSQGKKRAASSGGGPLVYRITRPSGPPDGVYSTLKL
ncbi:MAG: hypothetical protein ABFS37_11100, partial [Acidobacteriota bacterium]